MGLVNEVFYRLFVEGLTSPCVVLKLRLHDFTTFTRRRSRGEPYRSAEEAFEDARELLSSLWDGRTEIRLIGFGFASLSSSADPVQGELFDEAQEKKRRAERAIFEIERQGLGELRRARLLDPRLRARRPPDDRSRS